MLVASSCGARTSLYVPSPSSDASDASTYGDASLDSPIALSDATTDAPAESDLIEAPRAIAPLSTATVTTRQPTFRWVLPSGVDGARIEICADRACSTLETTIDALGTSGKPTSDLAPGLHFYRLHGIANSVIGTKTDAAREVVVPRRSTPTDTSWGNFPDFDGDGYAEAIVAGQQNVSIFHGSSSSIHHKDRVELNVLPYVSAMASAGDVDGDGYGDFVVVTGNVPGELSVYRGGSAGITTTAVPKTIAAPAGYRFGNVSSVGDVNGDGYADVAVRASANNIDGLAIYLGGPNGLSSTPLTTLHPASSQSLSTAGEAGDVNGDHFADIVTVDGAHFDIFYGGPSGPSDATRVAYVQQCGYQTSPTPGDIDGDGLADIALAGGPSVCVFSGASLSTPTEIDAPSPYKKLTASVAFVGDVNGDGYDDFSASIDTGSLAAALYFGSPTGLSTASSMTFTAPHDSFTLIAAGGDFDRDGFPDVLLAETDGIFNWVYAFAGGTTGVTEKAIVAPWYQSE